MDERITPTLGLGSVLSVAAILAAILLFGSAFLSSVDRVPSPTPAPTPPQVGVVTSWLA